MFSYPHNTSLLIGYAHTLCNILFFLHFVLIVFLSLIASSLFSMVTHGGTRGLVGAVPPQPSYSFKYLYKY